MLQSEASGWSKREGGSGFWVDVRVLPLSIYMYAFIHMCIYIYTRIHILTYVYIVKFRAC